MWLASNRKQDSSALAKLAADAQKQNKTVLLKPLFDQAGKLDQQIADKSAALKQLTAPKASTIKVKGKQVQNVDSKKINADFNRLNSELKKLQGQYKGVVHKIQKELANVHHICVKIS